MLRWFAVVVAVLGYVLTGCSSSDYETSPELLYTGIPPQQDPPIIVGSNVPPNTIKLTSVEASAPQIHTTGSHQVNTPDDEIRFIFTGGSPELTLHYTENAQPLIQHPGRNHSFLSVSFKRAQVQNDNGAQVHRPQTDTGLTVLKTYAYANLDTSHTEQVDACVGFLFQPVVNQLHGISVTKWEKRHANRPTEFVIAISTQNTTGQ